MWIFTVQAFLLNRAMYIAPFSCLIFRADSIRHYKRLNVHIHAGFAHNNAEVRCMEKGGLLPSLDDSIGKIRRISGGSSDLLINRFVTGGIHCALICCEGMVSTSVITELIFEPITDIPQQKDSHGLFHYINEQLLLSTDRPQVSDYDTLFRLINSGFAVLIAEGTDFGLGFGVQGYNSRGVQEPFGEGNVMGAHEGFTETIRTNMSQIRRRLKSPELVMELFTKGKKSHERPRTKVAHGKGSPFP